MKTLLMALTVCVCLPWVAGCRATAQKKAAKAGPRLEWIHPSKDGARFVCGETGNRFIAWGVNYDHDDAGRLLEDYWNQEWPVVAEDFREMKELGANVVRVHLQVAKFMESPEKPNAAALQQLARLVRLAEETGLYLDITGLGCYHRSNVPAWYDVMSASNRWEVQAGFWEAVAKICAHSPAVFCYDLMNEPILPGPKQKETNWLTGELGGKCFVQRLTLDLGGQSQEEVAKAWVDKLVAAIRRHDQRHMITVGVIPWALVFPGAKPLFYAKEVSRGLDFVSVHFYPKRGEVAKALTALATYRIGKPLVVEEMFPLECSVEELDAFIDGSRPMADGWVGFYWGKTIAEYSTQKTNMPGAIIRRWLEYFRAKAPERTGYRPGAGPDDSLPPPG